jgi:C1A family cysteine protease/GH25 family lysozyme M1 (1,4-beta-N-acetylmuramidase)
LHAASNAAGTDPRLFYQSDLQLASDKSASTDVGVALGRPFDAKAASLYGQFVQAAYSMYEADPHNLTPTQSDDFPPGYKLVGWIQMQDFILESTGPIFYGFIAQSATNASRFVLAIRGTSNDVEWWDDASAILKIPFKIPACGFVGMGFARIYSTLVVIERPISSSIAAPDTLLPQAAGTFCQQVSVLVRRHGPAAMRDTPFIASGSIDVTGHSLGAALATLYTMENAYTGQIPSPLLCTFASPLVGDSKFATVFNRLDLTSWRIVNAPDVVPKLPPEILGFVHVDTMQAFDSSRKVKPTMSCWHSLSTYLSLIDPTQQPSAACRIPPKTTAHSSAALSLPVSSSTASGDRQMNKPFVIDIYQGDDVQDTPGPLGGFARTKASGIAFLIHKASEGLTGVDRRYDARRAAWMDGIPVPVTDLNGELLQITPRFAAYHFFHGQDPVAEAQHFLSTAALRPGDDAVVDWEEVGASGHQPSADAVDAFCKVVEDALGFPIIVYSGNVAKQQLQGKDPRFAKRRLWLASYGSHFKVQESWDYPWLWQDNGDQSGPGPNTIPGINGYCDNSTIVAPMTIKRLNAEWGGGSHASQAAIAGESTKITTRKTARYGWKPDLPDQRDYSYAVPAHVIQNIPRNVDLRSQCPPVYDQGQIGSCTANAIAAALEFDMMKQKIGSFTPSRLFIYYNERSMEGHVGSDSGAFIRDGIKSVANLGDCPESQWPYDGSPAQGDGTFPPGAKAAARPDQRCFDIAIGHRALTYQSVNRNLADMKGCLASGYPFVFGFTVYESFESAEVGNTGIVPMPTAGESIVGGHAVLAVGYDDESRIVICRNSWGDKWGAKGYFYMPYAYLLDDNLADDFWTISLVN